MVCLVQQLFRLKVNSEVDPNVLHDTGLFDILYDEAIRRSKIKIYPTMKALNQEIRLTRRADHSGATSTGCSAIISTDSVGIRTGSWNKGLLSGSGEMEVQPLLPKKLERFTPHLKMEELESLGLLDIVNMLRSLRHPHIYNRSIGYRNWYYRQLSSSAPYGFRAPAGDRPPTKTDTYLGNDLIITFVEVDKLAIDESIRDGLLLDEELFGEGREWVGKTVDEIREEIRVSDLHDISEFIERMINKAQPFVWKVVRVGDTWRGTLRESE